MTGAVPLVDLTPWYAGGDTGRAAVAAAVDAALRDAGFLLVTGHRVGPELCAGLRARSREFFALPVAAKRPYATPVGGRGWIPPGAEANAGADGLESPPDLKESFTMGFDAPPPGTPEPQWYPPNIWPAEPAGLRGAATAFADACSALADDLLEIAAAALGLAPDFLTGRCDVSPYSVNVNFYPAHAQVGTVAPGQFRIGQHTDFGTLTILDRQPGLGGLQVRMPDDTWVDAPFIPGALTINTGDLMARWTGDRWRSTPHRVLPPPADAPTEELTSLVFFHEANPDTVVETLPEGAGPHRYEPVTAGEFLRGRLASIAVG
jgi:isopenicillin N synthase-like dioxygenase